MIKKILENDTKNCYEAISADTKLTQLDADFYETIGKLPGADKFKLEDIFSTYMARITRIAYLQGMKDFSELHTCLKEDTSEILKKYVD